MIGHFKRCCKKLGNFPINHSNWQNQSSSTGSGRMNIPTAAPQLDADFFDERGLPKVYNLPPAHQVGSMNIPQENNPRWGNSYFRKRRRNSTDWAAKTAKSSVSGSVPASDFSQIEFLLTEVVNQSQIDFPSISDTLHLRETGNSLSKATKRTDFPLESMQNCSSDEEMRETGDLNVSIKPPQSTRDSCTTNSSNNSTIRKATPRTKTDNKEASRLYAELLLCVCWHTEHI